MEIERTGRSAEELVDALADSETRVPAYFELDWHILRPSDDRNSFITTDTPIIHAFTKPPEFTKLGPGELPDGIQVVAPLAHDCLLIMENDVGAPGFGKLSQKDIRGFNLSLAAAADRFIIGRDKALVESVAAAASRELYVSRDFDEALQIALEAAKEDDEEE